MNLNRIYRRKFKILKKYFIKNINLFLIIFSVIIFFSLTEFILSFFKEYNIETADPYIGIYNTYPFFIEKNDKFILNTKRYPQLYPQSFNIKKNNKTKRLFIMGGSNVYQLSEFDIKRTFIDHMKEKLKNDIPEYNWEIINCGGISWGSFHILRLTEQLIKYKPDALIIYSGHNDFSWRVFADNTDILKIPLWLIKLRAFSAKFRIYIFLRKIFRTIKTKYLGFYNKKKIFKEKYNYIDIFKKNIIETIKICKKNNIPVVLSTVPSNEMFVPVKSSFVPDSKEKNLWEYNYNEGNKYFRTVVPFINEKISNVHFQLAVILNISKKFPARWHLKHYKNFNKLSKIVQNELIDYYNKVFTLENKKIFLKIFHNIFNYPDKLENKNIEIIKKALNSYLKSYTIFKDHAMLNFKIGFCYYIIENYKKAEKFFRKSAVLDKMPEKSNDNINNTIKDINKETDVEFIDYNEMVRERSVNNIIGWDFFYDNCHLNIRGKYLLMDTIADRLKEKFLQ